MKLNWQLMWGYQLLSCTNPLILLNIQYPLCTKKFYSEQCLYYPHGWIGESGLTFQKKIFYQFSQNSIGYGKMLFKFVYISLA